MIPAKKSVQTNVKSYDRNVIKDQLHQKTDNKTAGSFIRKQNGKEDQIKDNLNGDKVYDANDGPAFTSQLESLSSIANWERRLRHGLELERELQGKEIERQKEILNNEWRKLSEKDKTLRIELDARERKIRQKEELIRSDLDEIHRKEMMIAEREKMIDEIVIQRTKDEISEEVEKLKKKFYQLEQSKVNLNKREEKLKDAEQKLHEQAILVKEKIDKKKDTEIEMAKFRKEYEIMKKENEILKSRLEELQDYQVVKFQNNSLKNELKCVKEALKNKITEFDDAKGVWEKEKKKEEEIILKLKMELRKCEQEYLLIKQKHQGEINEWSHKNEQLKLELQHSKSFAQQIAAKNKVLANELVSVKAQFEKLLKRGHNTDLIPNDTTLGCQFCDQTSIEAQDLSNLLIDSHHGSFDNKFGNEKADFATSQFTKNQSIQNMSTTLSNSVLNKSANSHQNFHLHNASVSHKSKNGQNQIQESNQFNLLSSFQDKVKLVNDSNGSEDSFVW